MKKILSLIILVLLITISCGEKIEGNKEIKEEKRVTISAAASLKKSLDEIIENYKKDNPNVTINVNYGGSGALEKQIVEGAPSDIFMSAAKKNMDNLEKKDLILKETREDLLKNTLVLISPNTLKEKVKKIDDLKELEKIALGEVVAVPAGKYGKEVLEKSNLWSEIEKKIIYQKDVTAVLNIVELGEVDAGIVYLTDAKKLKNGYVVEEFSEDLYSPIVYPVAILKESKNKEEATKFLQYVKEQKSKEIFEKNGFKFKF